MNKTTWASIALCAAILAGCGGDPGSSGDPGDPYPPDTTGSGTATPHKVAIPVTLIAGDATDTVAQFAAVSAWKNTKATPMDKMPVPYSAYETDPIEVDANEKGLVQVGIDVIVDGYLTAVAPTPTIGVEQLQAAADTFPVTTLVARDLTTGMWSCTRTQKINGVEQGSPEVESSTITMGIDLTNDVWNATITAWSMGFSLVGDSVRDDSDPQVTISGAVTNNGQTLDVVREGSPGSGFYFHCE